MLFARFRGFVLFVYCPLHCVSCSRVSVSLYCGCLGYFTLCFCCILLLLLSLFLLLYLFRLVLLFLTCFSFSSFLINVFLPPRHPHQIFFSCVCCLLKLEITRACRHPFLYHPASNTRTSKSQMGSNDKRLVTTRAESTEQGTRIRQMRRLQEGTGTETKEQRREVEDASTFKQGQRESVVV